MKKWLIITCCIIVVLAFISVLFIERKKAVESDDGYNVPNYKVQDVSTREEKNLFDLLDDSPKVLIRLINSGCTPCHVEQAKLLKELSDTENLIVLVNSINLRPIRIFLRENNIRMPIYCLKETDVLLPNDDQTKLLILHVDENGTILTIQYAEPPFNRNLVAVV
ncbi:MAG: hypothetical protein LBU91_06250 [Bacteroidales bacterium]|jgi:hypothetical protein|nr:hypothetical protein [Bacteroidales bacterium]